MSRNIYFTWDGIGDNLCLISAAKNYYDLTGEKLLVYIKHKELANNLHYLDLSDLIDFSSFNTDNISSTEKILKENKLTPVFLNTAIFKQLAPEYKHYIATWQYKHIITRLCERLGLHAPIKIDYSLSLKLNKVNLNSDYVCIMTGGMQNYKAVNKTVMQTIVDKYKTFKFVQIGSQRDALLENVIDFRGCNLLDSLSLLQSAQFLVTGTGGLTHLARCVGCKAFVLQTLGEPLEIAYYNTHRYVSSFDECDICKNNLRDPQHQPCYYGYKCIRNLSTSLVLQSLEENLDYLLSPRSFEDQFEQAISDPAEGLEDYYAQTKLLNYEGQYFRG